MTTQQTAYRDGTSQKQRGLAALSPESVSVEERDTKYWLEFVQSYTFLLNFYDEQNNIAGDWSGLLADFTADQLIAFTQNPQKFLQQNNGEAFCQPHVVLLLTFLQLLRYPQQQFKQLTRRHLDFYYQQVLRLRPKSSEPDHVYLTFQLSAGKKQYGLKQGTLLDAGKDSGGAPLCYALKEDTELSMAKVSVIKTMFVDEDPANGSIKGIYPHTVYDRAQQKTFPQPGFPLFGCAQSDKLNNQYLGLAIASPLLRLENGAREITLTLSCLPDGLCQYKIAPDQIFENKAPFVAYLSGLNAFLTPTIQLTPLQNTAIKRGFEELTIPAEADSPLVASHKYGAILDYPGELLPDQVADNHGKILICPKNLAKTEGAEKQIYWVESNPVSKKCQLLYLGEMNITESFTAGTARLYPSGAVYYDLIFKLILNAAQAAIVTPPNTLANFDVSKDYPTLALLIDTQEFANDTESASYYDFLNSIEIASFALTVDASSIQNFIISNDIYPLNNQKPFAPFGPHPVIGSNFYVTHPEFCEKTLTQLTLQIDWLECPANFAAYYQDYQNEFPITNDSFSAKLICVNDGKQEQLGNITPLFGSAKMGERFLEQSTLVFDLSASTTAIAADKPCTRNSNNPLDYPIYYKVELQKTDFQHQNYAKRLLKISLENAIKIKEGKGDNLVTLNPPYTPMVKRLTISYKSSIRWTDPQSFTGVLAHIGPFGWNPIEKTDKKTDGYRLLSSFQQRGYLFIGIENISLPQNLSLLFKLDAKQPSSAVSWHYLANNQWHALNAGQQLITDGTSGLHNTGIIKFCLDQSADNNTQLPNDKYWLRATINEINQAENYCYTIQTNAASAIFVTSQNQLNRESAILPPGSIKGLLKYKPQIGSVTQTDHSFSGRLPENSAMFYTRISERLRHKQRALTIWDYEHMVLAQFPEVYKVKCLPSQDKPGGPDGAQITLVIIPRGEYSTGSTFLRPEAPSWLLQRIKDYMQDYVSPFVTVKVKNPEYKTVRCSLFLFLKTAEKADYQIEIAEMEQVIIRYLSPWRYETQADIPFCSCIYTSSLIQHIESYPYMDIDYVRDLEFNSDNRFFIEVARPDEILVSDIEHEIKFYSKEK
jgi:hypothetical protein